MASKAHDTIASSQDPDDDLLTVEYVADHCAVSPRTVRRWIVAGKLKARRLNRRILRIPRSSYRKFRDSWAFAPIDGH